MSPLPMEGRIINLDNAWHVRPLIREGSLLCLTYCDKGPRFLQLQMNDHPYKSPLKARTRLLISNPNTHGTTGSISVY